MPRLVPPLILFVCALLFISGGRYFSPAPLDLILGASAKKERRVEITIINAPAQNEANETYEGQVEANESDASSQDEARTIDENNAPPPTSQAASARSDGLQTLLANLGYPFADGSLQKSACASGQTCVVNGVLRGLNFSELYCRAVAFSRGREMPKYAPSPSQSFEVMQFWSSRRPTGLDAIYLVSEPFTLSGSLFSERGTLKGSLSLSFNARWRFPCEMSESWQSVSLPLRCVAKRGQSSLDCSLDLRALIESLSGVAAKASEPTRQKQIDELRENLQEQFKRRVRERPNIEEIDLRYLF
ncbi:MAG: hypothetical protein LBI57_07310 [Helicobacteraceae bacterium]|jgi:hypothetical protein|nr:hypothetical protein [Helicobacteraceae bacterium]